MTTQNEQTSATTSTVTADQAPLETSAVEAEPLAAQTDTPPPPAAQPPVENAEPAVERTEPAAPAAPVTAEDATPTPETSDDAALFGHDDLSGMRSRWDDVQAAFVDDPKECVQKADSLVADLVEQLTTGFSEARSRLEAQWARGEEASTEDLRLALKRYREFFQRLLAV